MKLKTIIALLLLVVFARGEQQISTGQVNGLTAFVVANAPGGSGGSIPATWTASGSPTTAINAPTGNGTTYSSVTYPSTNAAVIIVGESIGNGLGVYPAAKSAFSGKCNFYNYGHNGHTIGDAISEYSSEIYQYRPSNNGGKSVWLVMVVAVNNLDAGVGSGGITSGMDSYVTQAHTDGFKVAVCTTYYGAGNYHVNTSNLLSFSEAAACEATNRYFLQSALYDLVIPLHSFVAGPTDPLMASDRVHLTSGTNGGYDNFANLISNVFIAGYTQVRPAVLLKSTGDDSIATHYNMTLRTHKFLGSAQGQISQTIAYASSVTWDVSSKQVARLNATGNCAITAANLLDGHYYTLQTRANGNTLTFDPAVFVFPKTWEMTSGGKETDTSGQKFDEWLFRSDGVYLHRISRTVIDPTRTPTSGALMEDYFISNGTDTSINGRAPDTVQVSSNTWTASGTSVSASGDYMITPVFAAGECKYNVGTHTGYSFEWDSPAAPTNAGAGTDNSIGWLFVFRFDPALSPRTSATLVIKCPNGGGTYRLFSYPNGYTIDAGTQLAATTVAAAAGQHLKIALNGTAINFYINGSLQISATSSLQNSSSNTAIGYYFPTSFGQSVLDAGPGNVRHVLMLAYP